MCDTINPVGNVYCQRCNARLVPMSSDQEEEEAEEQTRPIKGFSLPTIPLDETAGEEEEHAPEQADEGEPPPEDWLDELRGSTDQQPERTGQDEQAQGEQEPLEPADIPDWLSELGSAAEEPPDATSVGASPEEKAAARKETTSEEPPTGAAGTTQEPSPSAAAETEGSEARVVPPAEEDAVPEAAEIPDWLRELGPVGQEIPPLEDEAPATQEPSVEEPEVEQPPDEIPDFEETPKWLQDVLPSQPTPTAEREAEAGDAESAVIEIPDWLEEAEAGAPPRPPERVEGVEEEPAAPTEPGRAASERETSSPTETPSESVAIPSWLREAEPELEEGPSESPVPPFTEELPENIETPEWLTELMKPTPEEGDEGAPFSAELGITEEEWHADVERAQIPDWLQQLEPSRKEGKEVVRGPLETEGLLRGLRGLIPATHAIGTPTAFEGLRTPRTNEASRARAELFQSLLGQPAIQPTTRPRREAEGGRSHAVELAERWLVAGALILAVLGVLLTPLLTGQRVYLTQPVTSSGATDLHRVIGNLDSGDLVLVAFDYGPPEADELNAVAEPVLAHVLERGARISIVSTRPDGPLVARALISRLADSEDQYRFIGYRPGTATAISQLLNATDRAPTLLMVLTSRPTPLRLWIEQAYARYGDQLPLVAVGSAALEPVASPYLDASAGQLRGAVHGLKGAAAYEALRTTIGGATQRLDALAAGHVVIVMLMIIGALIHAVGGTKEGKV